MLKNYIKIAFKVMLRKKYYTFLALVGISFTIMIATMAASFIDQIVGANSSEPNRNRTLVMKDVFIYTKGDIRVGNSGSLNLVTRYISTLKTPEKVSFYRDGGYISVLNNTPRAHRLKYTDGDFWYITGFKFTEGKPFNAGHIRNASRVVVITEELRKYYFNDGSAIGKPVLLQGNEFRVIGVVESAPLLSDASSDAWIPYTAVFAGQVKEAEEWPEFWGPYKAMLLAKSSDDFKEIKQEMSMQMRKLVLLDPKVDSVGIYALTALEQFAKVHRWDPNPDYGLVLTAMISSLVLFMLIPVISLVNLNISRMAERAVEIGIRKSFGASSTTLTAQFIVENIILTLTGGAIGLGLAFIVSDGLVAILNTFDPLFKMSSGQFILSWRVFAFSIGCCLFFGFLSGVYPAYRMSRLHPVHALKGENL